MPTWTLPDTVLQEGYDEQFPENTVKTSTDMGPGKSRQRSTAAPTPITCNVPLTPAQAVSLESFYKSDCAYGALAFDWKHPRTGAAKSLELDRKSTRLNSSH